MGYKMKRKPVTQEELESMAIELFLSYGDVESNELLVQSKHLQVKERDFTGLGFFTCFSAPENLAVGTIGKRYDGLSVNFKNSKDYLSFILYVTDGYIDCLEAYTAKENWQAKDIEDLDLDSFYGGGQSSFV